MPVCLNFVRRRAALIILATALTALSVPAASQADSNPFVQLAGSWRGSGTVSPLGAEKERVLCRVSYKVAASEVHQVLECASSDYRITVNSDINVDGEQLSGKWSESNFGLGGGISGLAKGDTIFVRINGEKFQGRMTIKVESEAHTVDISQFDSGNGRYSHMASMTLRR